MSAAWYIVALVLTLTICVALVSAFHEVRGAELDIPVSFSVDAQALPVSAPSLGIEAAHIQNVRGS